MRIKHKKIRQISRSLMTLLLSTILGLSACSEKSNPNTIVVGTMAGPETELVELARNIAHDQYGLTVKIIEFSDYNLPNVALQDGTLDVNIFQHLPYLNDAIEAHHYDLEVAGKTFLYPAAIYSSKIKSLKALQPGAIIAIPNDPSNEARALVLLQEAGLIRLKHKQSAASLDDIKHNPKRYQFRELDAAQLPRVLPDVDIAVINTNFAIPAGLNPKYNGLFTENKNSPYANLIVVRKDTPKMDKIKLLIDALHSEKVKEKAKNLFSGAAIPAW